MAEIQIPDRIMRTFSFKEESTLFVFGPARGGTTYLSRFLDEWFDYGMGPEGTFIRQFYNRLGHYGDLSKDSNLARLASDISESETMQIMRNAWPDYERVDVTAEAILNRTQERSYAGVVFAALAAVADLRGKGKLGTKEPDFWKYWEVLDQLFGTKAKYLCIVRDGRDVALSLFREKWGLKSVYIAAKHWVEFLETAEEIRNKLPPERFLVIRYETLLTEPEYSVSELEKITGAELTNARRAHIIDELRRSKYANNFNKWKTSMSKRDVGIFESIAADWLDVYGYELSGEELKIAFPERTFYELEEVWRKTLMTVRGSIKGSI